MLRITTINGSIYYSIKEREQSTIASTVFANSPYHVYLEKLQEVVCITQQQLLTL
ncbi:MAG TPA: hypothetical protein VFV86_06300 [Nitrososphaeraceae archaeon]|nr:hypothetical protein [Nitrososphaeraceae archaeon]